MLINMKVENFKSFENATELSMICSSKIRKKKEDRVIIKRTRLLKYGVIYGANASGKTNLVEFFRFFQRCMKRGLTTESSQLFCKNRKENRNKDSSFELQISVGDDFYAYGFSAILNDSLITGEWLYKLNPSGTAELLFEREAAGKVSLGESVKLDLTEGTKFKVYAEDFEGNTTRLFLSEMNQGKKYTEDSRLLFFQKIYQWLTRNILIISPDMPVNTLLYCYEKSSMQKINELIRTFDTGISQLEIENISMEKLEEMLPQEVYKGVMRRIHEQSIEEKNMFLTMRSDRSFFTIIMRNGEEPIITTLKIRHEKSFYDFRYEEESDGTRRLFDLMDMLLNQEEDVVYIVDELERSLHPKLTEHFLKLFRGAHEEDRTQLLFTTHESALMDQTIFRRDEIWFVERNVEGNSTIYSLDRFKERYDKALSKAYLEGRYGVIPVFSSFCFEEEEMEDE